MPRSPLAWGRRGQSPGGSLKRGRVNRTLQHDRIGGHGDISGTLTAALKPKSLKLLALDIVSAALNRRHQRRRQASREASPGPQKNKREGLCPPFCALCGVPHSTPAIRSPGFAGRRPFWHRRGVGHIPSPPVSRTLPSRQPVNIACRHHRGARPRRQRQMLC